MIYHRKQRGVALLEALLAAVLLAIGLLGTIGLQARAYSALSDAGMRSEATIAAEQLLGLMNTDQANLDAYAIAANGTVGAKLVPWYNQTRSNIPGAAITVGVAAAAGTSKQVDISISWTRKAGATGNLHRNTHSVRAYIAKSGSI